MRTGDTKRGGRRTRLERVVTSPAPTPEGIAGGLYRPLKPGDLERVHRAALEVLESVGMAGATPTVTELALAKGCRLGEGGRLLFPAALIEDVIAGACRSFPLFGQDPKHDLEAKAGQLHFATGGAAVTVLDGESGRYRPSTLADLYDLARLADTLANIQWFARPVVATEIEDWRELDLNTVYACAAGTQKHLGSSITLPQHVADIEALLDLVLGAEGAFRRRPFLSVHATTVVSPLTFAADSSDVATAAARIGMPVHSQTGPQSGATAPAALAGTLVQVVAETLVALTAINLVRPGHPVIAGGWPFVSDLRTGAFTGGSGEQALLSAGLAQLMTFYDLPSGTAASMTDSKLPDNQAGYEKGVTTLLTALSGPTFLYESAGMLASLMGCSPEAMVIDDEMLSSIRRCMRGIEVSDETLSVRVIAEAARGPGHFLGHEQTLSLMQSEYVYPQLADRQSIEVWQERGGHDMVARARARVRETLAQHYPSHLSEATDRQVRNRFPIRLPRRAMTVKDAEGHSS
ncbi:MAG: trimethylamine methyltransferase family protein [Kiloniellales bacterium]